MNFFLRNPNDGAQKLLHLFMYIIRTSGTLFRTWLEVSEDPTAWDDGRTLQTLLVQSQLYPIIVVCFHYLLHLFCLFISLQIHSLGLSQIRLILLTAEHTFYQFVLKDILPQVLDSVSFLETVGYLCTQVDRYSIPLKLRMALVICIHVHVLEANSDVFIYLSQNSSEFTLLGLYLIFISYTLWAK